MSCKLSKKVIQILEGTTGIKHDTLEFQEYAKSLDEDTLVTLARVESISEKFKSNVDLLRKKNDYEKIREDVETLLSDTKKTYDYQENKLGYNVFEKIWKSDYDTSVKQRVTLDLLNENASDMNEGQFIDFLKNLETITKRTMNYGSSLEIKNLCFELIQNKDSGMLYNTALQKLLLCPSTSFGSKAFKSLPKSFQMKVVSSSMLFRNADEIKEMFSGFTAAEVDKMMKNIDDMKSPAKNLLKKDWFFYGYPRTYKRLMKHFAHKLYSPSWIFTKGYNENVFSREDIVSFGRLWIKDKKKHGYFSPSDLKDDDKSVLKILKAQDTSIKNDILRKLSTDSQNKMVKVINAVFEKN